MSQQWGDGWTSRLFIVFAPTSPKETFNSESLFLILERHHIGLHWTVVCLGYVGKKRVESFYSWLYKANKTITPNKVQLPNCLLLHILYIWRFYILRPITPGSGSIQKCASFNWQQFAYKLLEKNNAVNRCKPACCTFLYTFPTALLAFSQGRKKMF